MSEKKKDIQIPIEQVPPEGALGLLAMGDVGVMLWRQARDRKAKGFKEENQKR